VDAAASGDTIILADGVFAGGCNRDVLIHDKGLVIRSQSGQSADCRIDCGGSDVDHHRAFIIDAPGGAGTRVENIEIRNGYSDPEGGGAILVSAGSSLTLQGCDIRNCVGDARGGAIRCQGDLGVHNCFFASNMSTGDGGVISFETGELAIAGSEFGNNHAGGDGGAVHAEGWSELSVSGCEFAVNGSNYYGGASTRGGALYVRLVTDGQGDIVDCQFTGNHASGGTGGAVYISGVAVAISGSDFSGNDAEEAGALYLEGAQIDHGGQFTYSSVSDCRFLDNFADADGGAIFASDTRFPVLSPIESSVFAGNHCGDYGGAVYVHDNLDEGALLLSCTFHGNAADDGGSAVAAYEDGRVDLANCLVAFGAGEALSCDVAPQIECCDIYGNTGGDWTGDIAGLLGQFGNISADPYFCDAATGDLTLREDSPCLAANNDCGDMGALGEGCEAPVPVDVIGLYADEQGTLTELDAGTGSLVTLYLVIKNAADDSGILAWECALPVPAGLMLVDVDFRG